MRWKEDPTDEEVSLWLYCWDNRLFDEDRYPLIYRAYPQPTEIAPVEVGWMDWMPELRG